VAGVRAITRQFHMLRFVACIAAELKPWLFSNLLSQARVIQVVSDVERRYEEIEDMINRNIGLKSSKLPPSFFEHSCCCSKLKKTHRPHSFPRVSEVLINAQKTPL
jgi:hypothetical protein